MITSEEFLALKEAFLKREPKARKVKIVGFEKSGSMYGALGDKRTLFKSNSEASILEFDIRNKYIKVSTPNRSYTLRFCLQELELTEEFRSTLGPIEEENNSEKIYCFEIKELKNIFENR